MKNNQQPNPNLKKYIIRKYIFAESAIDAIKKDKNHPVEDVWIDEDYKKQNLNQPIAVMGFTAEGGATE